MLPRGGWLQRLAERKAKLADRVQSFQVDVMVFAELKPQLEKLPHDEKLKALAFLKHALRAENPEYQRELTQRHTDIDAGKKVALTEAKQRLGRT